MLSSMEGGSEGGPAGAAIPRDIERVTILSWTAGAATAPASLDKKHPNTNVIGITVFFGNTLCSIVNVGNSFPTNGTCENPSFCSTRSETAL